MIRLKKIKVTKEERIHIQWQEQKGSAWDDHILESIDAAMPDFYKAMEKLAKHVVQICEFPESDTAKISVKSVSFSHGGVDEVPGATISASKSLIGCNAPLNLNTPHKAFEMYNEGQDPDKKALHTDECIQDLKLLQYQAELYIQGKRQQQDLFSQSVDEATGEILEAQVC